MLQKGIRFNTIMNFNNAHLCAVIIIALTNQFGYKSWIMNRREKAESKRANRVLLIQVANCPDHLTNRAGQIRNVSTCFQVVESARGQSIDLCIEILS